MQKRGIKRGLIFLLAVAGLASMFFVYKNMSFSNSKEKHESILEFKTEIFGDVVIPRNAKNLEVKILESGNKAHFRVTNKHNDTHADFIIRKNSLSNENDPYYSLAGSTRFNTENHANSIALVWIKNVTNSICGFKIIQLKWDADVFPFGDKVVTSPLPRNFTVSQKESSSLSAYFESREMHGVSVNDLCTVFLNDDWFD